MTIKTPAKKRRGVGDEPAIPDNPPDSTYSEEACAERLGIPLEAVKSIRASYLIPGPDFTRTGHFVRVSRTGLDKMAQLLGEKNAGPDGQEIRTLIVTAANLMNPRIVMAMAPGDSTPLRVRVKSAEKWLRGMAIPKCRKIGDGLYAYEGRQPRFKGRM